MQHLLDMHVIMSDVPPGVLVVQLGEDVSQREN